MTSTPSTRKARLNLRGFTSVMSMLCFVALTISGFLLFFMPPGRVANFEDFRLAGLGKAQWQVLHISFSLLFLVFGVLHLILNWRAMVNYFRKRSERRLGLNWQWVLPVLICAAVVWGATTGAWPFSQIEQWRREVKASYGGGGRGGQFGAREQESPAATQSTGDRQIRRRYRGGANQ